LRFKRLPKPDQFEPIRNRMLSMWLTETGDNAAVVAFTSPTERQGTSTIVAGLARSFGNADTGGTLVLDVATNHPRVADLLLDKPHKAGSIVRDKKNGLHMLTLADSSSSRPGGAARSRQLIQRLQPKYRLILIDAGALSQGHTSNWLAAADYLAKLTRQEGLAMKRKRFSVEHITTAVQQQEMGTPVREICRKLGIAEATFYRQKKEHGGLQPE
jgi:cellulose biosynthesis protein BcsQ